MSRQRSSRFCCAILITFISVGLISCVNSQSDSVTTQAPQDNGNGSDSDSDTGNDISNSNESVNDHHNGNSTNVVQLKCGNTQQMVDECFKDLPPHLMEFLQTTKIAINERDMASKCTVFNRGMKCFDDYTARCLTNRTLHLFKNNVEGARRFFMRFCSDREFQKDYLRHKDCFSYIQDDWVRCTENFQNILTEELHGDHTNVTNKFMEFCCARHAYENCIYNSARYKCYKNSAKFARDTAKTLSDEKHFTNCRQYETALCHSGYVGRHLRPPAATWTGLLLCAWLPAVLIGSRAVRRLIR